MLGIVVGFVFLIFSASSEPAQLYKNDLPAEHQSIQYWTTPADNPVSHLISSLESGEQTLLPSADGSSYLHDLMRVLDIRADSQTLVFAQNSLQRAHISPRTPRAIYFNDDVAIGFVPGATVIEISSVDSKLGTVFFTLSIDSEMPPKFERPRICLSCHQGPATLGVPGIYVSSMHTTPSGKPDFRMGSIVTDHRSPFSTRWGGWFVDSANELKNHRGNTARRGPADTTVPRSGGVPNLISLLRELRTTAYPTSSSDIVALMTLEHQTQMTNLLTRLNWTARLLRAGDESIDTLNAEISELVSYMLFKEEAKLLQPLKGVSMFTETFSAKGPFDQKGRSLREFDLRTRLFKYPLSYMIYTKAFDNLPSSVRDKIYRRLYEFLTQAKREETIEILKDTKTKIPSFWR